MEAIKYFPEGIATGEAFINRIKERQYLSSRIKSARHTVLIAPRRYGKTSLVTKVADELNIPFGSVDLLAAYSESYVRDQLVDKISALVFELLPNIKKAKEKLMMIFKRMKPEISLGVFGQRLSLSLSSDPLKDITELLLKLDEVAKHFKKRAVIFIDEFQQISRIKNYHSIEASIRHAVERSERIAYVFSGSNRHLLQQMFGDQGRPLYRLCQIIKIERMPKQIYIEHLNKLAYKKWKKHLPNEVLENIFYYTAMHPFYINVLCQALWENQFPSDNAIETTWCNYVKTQRQIISHDIMELSLNQQRLMTALSKTPIKEIQSSDFTATIKISTSSAQQALEVLLKKDLVYQTDAGLYRVLDPAIEYYLNELLWEKNQ